MYCIVLYCAVLYCLVLPCIVLYCIVLYCIVLYCIVLYCMFCTCFWFLSTSQEELFEKFEWNFGPVSKDLSNDMSLTFDALWNTLGRSLQRHVTHL